MNITRRALLHTLTGIPLGCTWALAEQPKTLLAKKVPAKVRLGSRIDDILSLSVQMLARTLLLEGIEFTDEVDTRWPLMMYTVIPWEDAGAATYWLTESHIQWTTFALAERLKIDDDSKCRFVGVEAYWGTHGLIIGLAASQTEVAQRYCSEALGSYWLTLGKDEGDVGYHPTTEVL